MKFALHLCSILILFTFNIASEQPRTIRSVTLSTKFDLFLEKGRDLSLLYPDSQEYKENPKGVVLNNIWCWSKADSDPHCSTVLYAENDSILLSVEQYRSPSSPNEILIMKWCGENSIQVPCVLDSIKFKQSIFKPEWMPQADSLLMLRLGNSINHLRSISIIKDEETDRLWGVMEGFYIGMMVGVVAMVLEIPIAALTESEYNWYHVMFSGLGSATGYSIYRCATYDTNPRSLQVRINLIKF